MGFLAGLLLGLIVGIVAGLAIADRTTKKLIATLESDRELARNEAKVFRGLLFPVLNRSTEEAKPAPELPEIVKKPAQPAAAPPPVNPLQRPRHMRTKTWFNQVRRILNSKQQRTDALSSAIEQARVQFKQQVPLEEKTNHVHA
jgi:hypothetical protein